MINQIVWINGDVSAVVRDSVAEAVNDVFRSVFEGDSATTAIVVDGVAFAPDFRDESDVRSDCARVNIVISEVRLVDDWTDIPGA